MAPRRQRATTPKAAAASTATKVANDSKSTKKNLSAKPFLNMAQDATVPRLFGCTVVETERKTTTFSFIRTIINIY